MQDKNSLADAVRSGVEISAKSVEVVGILIGLIAATPPHDAEHLAETIKPR